MKLISHRGNLIGPNVLENSPKFLIQAIEKGFDVEVDIRLIDKKWYLGHDNPEYEITESFIEEINNFTWFHCKNLEALHTFDKNNHKFFWHQTDDFSLTSNGYIWTYPGKQINIKSIIVDLKKINLNQYQNCYGICGDYVEMV
jgi:hypothetical protein